MQIIINWTDVMLHWNVPMDSNWLLDDCQPILRRFSLWSSCKKGMKETKTESVDRWYRPQFPFSRMLQTVVQVGRRGKKWFLMHLKCYCQQLVDWSCQYSWLHAEGYTYISSWVVLQESRCQSIDRLWFLFLHTLKLYRFHVIHIQQLMLFGKCFDIYACQKRV